MSRLAESEQPYQVGDEIRTLLETLGYDSSDPAAAVRAIAAEEPRLAALVDPAMRLTLAPTRISASEKINVIPAHAALEVDCRLPPGVTPEEALQRVRELVGDDVEVVPIDEVTSNRSPVESPLMDAIDAWVTAQDDRATVVPIVMPAFTDSLSWRNAFPGCVAYGFCPTRHDSLYELWPRMHGVDERIDVRDVHFAADFFHALPQTLLK
jgi:acetylornithine deacetylase/succinyl-diaminopimelate desuccinylase-like protein